MQENNSVLTSDVDQQMPLSQSMNHEDKKCYDQHRCDHAGCQSNAKVGLVIILWQNAYKIRLISRANNFVVVEFCHTAEIRETAITL